MKKGKLDKNRSFTETFKKGTVTTIFYKDGSVGEIIKNGKKTIHRVAKCQ